MKAYYILLAFLFTGCITPYQINNATGVNDNITKDIPMYATEVTVTQSETTSGDLYDYLFQIIVSRGHRIDYENKDRLYFTTQGKDVGQSTLQRMTVSVMDISDSMAQGTIHTEWMAGTMPGALASGIMGVHVSQQWEEAYWYRGRPGIAYAESVSIAWKIPRSNVSYN